MELVNFILNLLTISEIQTSRSRELLLVLIRIHRSSSVSVTESTKKLQVNHVRMTGLGTLWGSRIPTSTIITWQLTKNLTNHSKANHSWATKANEQKISAPTSHNPLKSSFHSAINNHQLRPILNKEAQKSTSILTQISMESDGTNYQTSFSATQRYLQCMSLSCSYSMKAYPRGLPELASLTIRMRLIGPYVSNSRLNFDSDVS